MLINLYSQSRYISELADVVRAFGFEVQTKCEPQNADVVVVSRYIDGSFQTESIFKNCAKRGNYTITARDALERKRLEKRYEKLTLYYCMKEVTRIQLAWGALTGIRPTRLAYDLEHREKSDYKKVFTELFDVEEDKIKLVEEILRQQEGLRTTQENTADLYVNIPFCTTRCSYCSFPSGVISKMREFVAPYCECLKSEIERVVSFAEEKGIVFKSVYFGGGTPTALNCAELEELIAVCPKNVKEFTVEAGRPDTIDTDKLSLFARYGVTRISVNPQSFNQSVLDKIGRCHSVQAIYDTYERAKSFPFVINMDLIAGLPTESYEMFCSSVDKAIELSPHNITVHTLAMKKGSDLKLQAYSNTAESVKNMVDYAHTTLRANGYSPYYLYRQKYMSDNLENVGFCKTGFQCVYNIDNMEETTSILACGANAISKKIFVGSQRIERIANPKDIATYMDKYESLLDKKMELFS